MRIFGRMEKMTKKIGVYLLIKNKKVIYVGRSKNVERRIKNHTDKEYDEVKIVECQLEETGIKEQELIKQHLPKYNDIPNRDSYSGLVNMRKKSVEEIVSYLFKVYEELDRDEHPIEECDHCKKRFDYNQGGLNVISEKEILCYDCTEKKYGYDFAQSCDVTSPSYKRIKKMVHTRYWKDLLEVL